MYRRSEFGFASACDRIFLVGIVLWGISQISMGWAGDEVAAKFNRVLKLGEEAPVWEGLLETGGSKLGLADFKEQRAVVLFFTRNHCPMTAKYAQRIRDLSREFSGQGVVIVGVNGSRKPGEDLQSMQKTRERLGWEFPYLKDTDGSLPSKYGATVTPQFFLLDGSRRVVYMGALDDHSDVKKVQEQYLRWGIEQVLAGKEVEIAESLPLGCQIEEAESEKE